MANYLELLNTPEGQRLSALGYTPEEIFQGAGTAAAQAGNPAQAPILGGGSGVLPYIVDMAGTAANYDIGRGNLANTYLNDRYQRMANPFNIVSALQEYANSGNTDLLNAPLLHGIAPDQGAAQQRYLDQLYQTPPASYLGAAGGSTAGGLDAATQQRIRDAYAQNPNLAQQFFSGHTGGIGAPSSVAPGGTPTNIMQGATSGAPSVAVPAPGSQTAQQAASRLLAAGLPGMSQTGFRSALGAGGVAGLGQLTESDFGRLSGDQQGAYAGILGSTGRVSNPAQAIAEHFRRYSAPGLRLGGVGY